MRHIHQVISLLITLIFSACHPLDKEIILQEKNGREEELIKYTFNEHDGIFLFIYKTIKPFNYKYIMHITSEGRILNIVKMQDQGNSIDDATIEFYRNMFLLVTDTLHNDPTFFGSPINGYYNSTIVNNGISVATINKKMVTPLTQDEKEIFEKVDRLMHRNSLRYEQFDSTKVLGWFNYVF